MSKNALRVLPRGSEVGGLLRGFSMYRYTYDALVFMPHASRCFEIKQFTCGLRADGDICAGSGGGVWGYRDGYAAIAPARSRYGGSEGHAAAASPPALHSESKGVSAWL